MIGTIILKYKCNIIYIYIYIYIYRERERERERERVVTLKGWESKRREKQEEGD